MNIPGDSRCVKIVIFTLFFLVNISLSPAYSEIKGIHIDDKKGYAKLTIYLNKPVSYTAESSGGKQLILNIYDDSIDRTLPSTKYRSRYVREIEAYKGEEGKTHLRVTLFNKISRMSDFFLKSPPRIVLNIKAGPVGRIKDETRQIVKVINSKNPKKDSDRPPVKPANTLPDKKTITTSLLNQLEGLEDLITPPIDRFVEIFDTETPLSVYHISLPSEEKLKDFPTILKGSGEYDLKEAFLKKTLEYLDRGDYKGSLHLLKNAPPKVKKNEEYAFLKADAIFQKSLYEGEVSEAINKYVDLTLSYPQSRYIPWAWMQIGRGRLRLKAYKGAAEAFKNVINKFPGSPYSMEAEIDMAKSIAGKGEREKALQLYKGVIKNNPSNPWLAKAVFGAAETMGHLGRYKKAGILFEKALKRWPDYPLGDPDNLMMIGESFYRTKRFDDAAMYFNKLVNIYPDYRQSDRAMGRVGDIYFHLGNIKSARQVYQETESRYPGSDGALIGMIRRADLLVSEGGSIGMAMGLYKQVYEKYTENVLAEVATLKAGLFLTRLGRYPEAFELFESFMTLYPKSKLKNSVFSEIVKTFTLLIDKSYKAGNCLELIRLAKNNGKLIEVVKRGNGILLKIGECYSRYGQYREAVHTYERIQDGPRFEEARFNLGKAAYMNGDMDSAVKVIGAFRKRFPQSSRLKEALYFLAKGNERLGKADKSAGFYKEYLKMEKDGNARAEALIALAGNLRKTGLTLDAVKAYREGIKLHPPGDSRGLSVIYFSLAGSLFDEGMFRKAMDAFNMVKKESSPDLYPQAAYKAALCLDRLGEREKAEKILGKVSEAGGGPFWNELSSAKLEDMRWQAGHD